MIDYVILYYTILYYTILYYTILYYTILYHVTLYYSTLGSDARSDSQVPRRRLSWSAPTSCRDLTRSHSEQAETLRGPTTPPGPTCQSISVTTFKGPACSCLLGPFVDRHVRSGQYKWDVCIADVRDRIAQLTSGPAFASQVSMVH